MKYLSVLLLLIVVTRSQAQVTFNKRFQFGCSNTTMTGLEVTDSCYYITGGARDTAHCIFGSYFMKMDTLGNVLFTKIYSTPQHRLEQWHPCLQTDVDGNLIIAGEAFDSNKISSLLIKYTPQGDTLWTRRYKNQTNPQHFLRSDDMVIAPDSSYILTGQMNSDSNKGFQILNVERNGSIRWNKTIGQGHAFHGKQRLIALQDGFVVGYMQSNANLVSINYEMFCNIKKNSYTGNLMWEWQNDTSLQLRGANDLIQTKDKGWVVGTAIVKEFLNPNPHTSTYAHDSYIFKLDSARNWLWGTQLRAYSYSEYAKIMKVIEQPDSSLLAFGVTADTVIINGDTSGHYNCLVAKLSSNGDSLWSHQYHYMRQAWANHEIFDVEQTHDGGYLIAGQAKLNGQGPYQQGWLLKLDQHGCLVPGCHLPDTTTSILPITSQPQAQLKLYPNPAVDYLNVLYGNKQVGEQLTFNILDQQGRVLQSYTTRDISDKTYVFPVWELLSGWYVLEVRQDGQLVGSEVFVKE